ncbi:MAG: alpha/beta hydrolase [Rhodobacter sp.]|nr:alpha/beta hydrolase [Rhodobacter sp.]
MTKTLIIPGLDGSPAPHWQHWWAMTEPSALLVAPAEPARSHRLAPFSPVPTVPLGVPACVVASRNDPWMSFGHAAALARCWQARLVDLGFAGHVNVASGYGPWPGGLRLRDALRAAWAPCSRGRTPSEFTLERRA